MIVFKRWAPILALWASFTPLCNRASADDSGAGQPKTFMVAVQPVGIGPLSTISRGFAAGYFLTPADIVALEFQSMNSIGGDTIDNLDAKVLGLHYKRLLGESFYVSGAIDSWQFKIFNHRAIAGQTVSGVRHFEGQSIAANFALGFQWQAKHLRYLVLGCELVGYIMPLKTNVDVDEGGFGSTFPNSTNWQALRLYLGLAF